MINEKTVLAIIPARGGSKGVPRKNIKNLLEKPLIAWTIEEAKRSKYIDRLILSSEDEEIISVAKTWDCEVPFKRPIELAQDETPGIDPVLHAIKMLPGYDYVILLQATSPLRKATDIDGAIELCEEKGANACVSVTESQKSPYWFYQVDTLNRLKPVLREGRQVNRRQDSPKIFFLNGAVYVARCRWLTKNHTFLTEETVAYIMPHERSVDIDTELDFVIAKLLMGGGKNE